MTDTIWIKGGRVIDPAANRDEIADVWIAGGIILGIGRRPDLPTKTKILEAEGLVVSPGLVDMHVHLREPGHEYKETIAGGCLAAVAGGVTSVAAMPNTRPTVDDVSVVEFILERARQAALANVLPIGAITRGLQGEELTEMGRLQRAGCVAFSDDGRPVVHSGVMRRAMDYAKAFGALLIQHAEDPSLVGIGCMNEGAVSSRMGLPGNPSAAEEILVDRDLRLVALTGCRYHVAHLSTAGAAEAVARAQQLGLPVSCEVTPHHLALTDEAVIGYRTEAKMSPPLRGEGDRQALREALARGIISVIASDHAPHEPDSKQTEFCHASNGVVGLETLLPIALELVRDGVLSLKDCLAKITCNPARLLGINRGTLAIGAPADVILFDPEAPWVVGHDTLHGTSRNTGFPGRRVQGKVRWTLVSGRIVWQAAP